MINVRRKRSPLIDLDPPKPLAVGEVCPHCGRILLATETGTARGDACPATEAETPAPVEISKTKRSREDAAKN